MATKKGNNSANAINGTSRSDTLYGLGGNDYLDGHAGNDKLYGGDGSDTILTGPGIDKAWGGNGNDALYASSTTGTASLHGEAGDDYLFATVYANAFLDGGAGNDTLSFSTPGRFVGGAGNDSFVYRPIPIIEEGLHHISGGAGFDQFHTSPGEADTAAGRFFTVEMRGESQGLFGFAGDLQNNFFSQVGDFVGINWVSLQPTTDVALRYDARAVDTDMHVSGAAGDDLFLSGDGDEVFTLGGGSDHVVFDFTPFEQGESPALPAMGIDLVTDFNPQSDTLSFSGGSGQFTTRQFEHDGVTTFDSYDLQGRHIHHLDVLAVGIPPMQHDLILG